MIFQLDQLNIGPRSDIHLILCLVSLPSFAGRLYQTQDPNQGSRAVRGPETGWPPTTPHSRPRIKESKARVTWPGRACRWMWAATGQGGPRLRPRTEAVSPLPPTLCLKSHPCPAVNCVLSAKPPTWRATGTTSQTSTRARSVAARRATSVASTPTHTSQR